MNKNIISHNSIIVYDVASQPPYEQLLDLILP